MSIDLDDEILQDFLVEAGELIDQLNEQLVDLEESPDDDDLLNAIFRGFHTVKGGAGFLGLDTLVEICHKSEDVFNALRNSEIKVTEELMDVILRGYDSVVEMFDLIREGETPDHPDQVLLDEISALLKPAATAAAPAPVAPAIPVETPKSAEDDGDITDKEFESILEAADDSFDGFDDFDDGFGDDDDEDPKSDITESEFDDLLDQLHGKGQHGIIELDESATAEDDGNITEEEFDAYLDNLHGEGKGPTDTSDADSSAPVTPVEDDGNITEEEFDAYLDNLHGEGKGPTVSDSNVPAPVQGTSPEPAPGTKAPVVEEVKKETPVAKPKVAKKKPLPKQETSVRVDTKRLDDIMNLVGELVLTRNRLITLRETTESDEVGTAINNLDSVTADLQTAVLKTRMQPIKKVFGRFPRVVRDMARSLDKKIKLELAGEETDLDKNLVESLADPLVHLVRNSVDHGIEMPADRLASGKKDEGTILLSASQEGDHILLAIKDDGAGMDPEILRKMAVKKGLMNEEQASRLSNKECFEIIFMPGSSTKEQISDISGRGVGMDVVKTKITQLNGSIDIDSNIGLGTTISIKVPLTLAILPTLMVQVGSRKFAIPLAVVNEIFDLDSKPQNTVDGKAVIIVRGKAPLLFHLNKWLTPIGETPSDGKSGQVIMIRIGNQAVGFVVDQVIGQEEVVIKPLGKMLSGLKGLAGATITGDGHIALILDMPGLLGKYT